ncbi:pyruvate ferredoxin oxidoreductase, partial [Thermococci archaeon]
MSKNFNIVISGVGGQGNILTSQIIAKAAIKAGLEVRAIGTYGAAQRGGSV